MKVGEGWEGVKMWEVCTSGCPVEESVCTELPDVKCQLLGHLYRSHWQREGLQGANTFSVCMYVCTCARCVCVIVLM